MFSPSINSAPAVSAPVRSSRRRQRPLSNDGGIPQPKAKRQRSALSHDTFSPPNGAPEMVEAKSQIATMPKRENSIPERREIAVRGTKPKAVERGTRSDGGVKLTENETYTVTKLPALPDRLTKNITARQHGAIYSDSGYALALTHSHALVWPYTINIPSPETFTFALPTPSKHASDPLPLGCLVSASASSSEPGLVVVIPTTGKITYWESVASAATLDLIHPQRVGVELAIQGMISGEYVIQILNAESAGFVLAFSSGRIAYMSVRDGQGRPAISVQFLRGGNNQTNGGIFSGIRNVLSTSALRGDIAAVRAGRPDKVGERSVLVASSKGKLQAWNLHRGGHNSLQAEADARESIVMAIKQTQPALSDLLLENFEILDFTYTPQSIGNTQFSSQDEEGTHILVLTSLTERQTSHYFLVEIVLKERELLMGNIRQIRSYTTPVNKGAISKPRIYLPNPALVSYVVFERAVVVMSMAKQPDSPDSQLRTESHILPQAFEDVIDFRAEMSVDIVGSGVEEPHGPSHGIEDPKSRRFRAKYPAVVLIVRAGGVVRIAATNINKLISSQPQQVTAKSKLEQAVFFAKDDNPLSFSVRSELQFPREEVCAAALDLSLEILKSKTPHIPDGVSSIMENLQQRSSALRLLAEHLRSTGVDLDRVTRWKLLWNAERMEAAAAVWKNYNSRLREKPEGQKRGLLTDIVEFIHENYKTEPVAEKGELDRVRYWFIKDIWNLETAIPWAYQVIREVFAAGQKDHGFVMKILEEANEMVIDALQSAYDFRSANLELYGLEAEELENGILKQGYEDLPEFWTSTTHIVNHLRKQTELAGVLLKEYWGKPPKPNIDPEVVDNIRRELPSVVDLAIRTSTERIRWDSAQNTPESQIEAENLKKLLATSQDDRIQMLAGDLELSDEAIALAEKYEIMSTLATVLLFEMYACGKRMETPGLESSEFSQWARRSDELHSQIDRLFAKFGKTWATALYQCFIDSGYMNNLLNQHQDQRALLTDFLRSKPEYAKVAWLHEVTREKNFDHAAMTLLDQGMMREQDLWSKKIELSIGKMARLAAHRSYSQSNGILIPDGGEVEITAVNHQLGLVKIQDQVFDYVSPSIEAAIDSTAELQLALEIHGNKGLSDKMAFRLLLESSMAKLVKHEAMDASSLIDLLTLMGDAGKSEEETTSFRGEQFYLAIQASLKGVAKKDEQRLTQQVIWRRCMLSDDWTDLNNTALKDDQQVDDRLRTTALYMAFRACFENRVFEKNSGLKPISPDSVLGAFTEHLHHRFAGLDVSIQETIKKDMQAEDEALLRYIETCQLEKWYQAALDLARRDIIEQVNEETADGEKMQSIADKLADIESRIARTEKDKAESLLHSRPRYKYKSKLSGSVGNFKSSSRI